MNLFKSCFKNVAIGYFITGYDSAGGVIFLKGYLKLGAAGLKIKVKYGYTAVNKYFRVYI